MLATTVEAGGHRIDPVVSGSVVGDAKHVPAEAAVLSGSLLLPLPLGTVPVPGSSPSSHGTCTDLLAAVSDAAAPAVSCSSTTTNPRRKHQTMATKNSDLLRVNIAALPDISKAEMDFYDSSFFRPGQPLAPRLPSPVTILQQHPDLGAGVVKYPHLNLAVKFGDSSYLRLEEAQTMRALRQIFRNNEVPVPEVFGWRKHGDQNFIYMSLVSGQTLQEAWPTLDERDKKEICGDLSRIIRALRKLGQSLPGHFIGSINGGTVQDRFFKLDYEKGPFLTIGSFHDWLLAAATRQVPTSGKITGPLREFLPDTGRVYFTHGDLTLGNIIISDHPGPRRIVGVVDWEQAGWYPEYWEYCKLLYGVEYTHEWRSAGWADMVTQAFEDEWEVFAEYSSWRCP